MTSPGQLRKDFCSTAGIVHNVTVFILDLKQMFAFAKPVGRTTETHVLTMCSSVPLANTDLSMTLWLL